MKSIHFADQSPSHHKHDPAPTRHPFTRSANPPINSIQHSPRLTQFRQQQAPLQRKANNTGLPDNLKSGVENLSGYSMDDVRVHYNSSKPAQLQAHAYAQGTDIHLAPGQEKHLPHEAWHVVQQKQGRVRPTMQMKGKVNVNDDVGLEREADVMGGRAISINTAASNVNLQPHILKSISNSNSTPVQLAMGFEFETNAVLENQKLKYKHQLCNHGWDGKAVDSYGPGWNAHVDGGKVEFSTQPVNSIQTLDQQMNSLVATATDMEDALLNSKQNSVSVEAVLPGGSSDMLVTDKRLKERKDTAGYFNDGLYADIQNTFSIELDKVPNFYNQIEQSGDINSYDKPIGHPMYNPFHISSPRNYDATLKFNLPKPGVLAMAFVDHYIWKDEQLAELVTPSVVAAKVNLSWVPKFTGLVTIIADYLNSFFMSNQFKSQSEYLKSDLPLLHRSNFSAAMGDVLNFEEDPTGEAEQSSEIENARAIITAKLPNLVYMWITELLENNPSPQKKPALKSYKAIHSQFTEKGVEPYELLRRLNTLKSSSGMKQQQLPNLGEWLGGITKGGTDRLSSKENGSLDSSSMGNLPLDTVEKDPKVIIENRSLMTRQRLGNWKATAERIFADYEKKIK